MIAPDTVLFQETQRYRDNPPFMLVAVVGTIFGWGLLIWNVLLGRPLGIVQLPVWLALSIGLMLGVGLPLAFWRMQMVTRIYPDRIELSTGATGNHEFMLADITAIDGRSDDVRGDYNNRNIASRDNSSVAYTVNSLQGVQLELQDGRLVLIGSLEPDALAAAAQQALNEFRQAEATRITS